MLYGYSRVSTTGHATNSNSLEGQEKELRAAGATEIYTDTYTGTKNDRPELTKLISRIEAGDTLIVAKLDRIARNAKEGRELIEGLMLRGVKVHILNMGLMDNSPTGKLIRHVLLAFAEFERDMIVARTQEGKAIAKAKPGYKEGRPKEYTTEQIRHAVKLLKSHTYKEVEQMTKISKSTLIRAKAADTAAKVKTGEVNASSEIP